MTTPWWGWMLVVLWCFPGVYAAFTLLLRKPVGGLDDGGEPCKQVPLRRKLIAFPVVLVLLVVVWPWVFWSEYRSGR